MSDQDAHKGAPAPVDAVERKRRQRSRSLVLALVLGGLVLTFYAITLVQLGHQSDAVDAAREAASAGENAATDESAGSGAGAEASQ